MLTIVSIHSRIWLGTILGLGLAVCLSVTPKYSANQKNSITLEISASTTYEQTLSVARQQAFAAAERLFQENAALSKVVIEAIGQRGTSRVPLMTMEVARSQWLQNPNPSSLPAQIYPESERLLFTSARNTALTADPNPETDDAIDTAQTTDEVIEEPTSPSPGPIAALAPSPRGVERWKYDEEVGDFVNQIGDSTRFLIGAENLAGSYIRFVDFPVGVYIQKGNDRWYEAVEIAVEDWSQYVPLKVVRRAEDADISIFYEETIVSDAAIANLRLGGEARPNLYADQRGNLKYRVDVAIAGYQTPRQISTVTRHEIGHALGLWGHSPNPNDLMSAVGRASRRRGAYSAITPHTLNTLQRIYELPTPIGQSAAGITF